MPGQVKTGHAPKGLSFGALLFAALVGACDSSGVGNTDRSGMADPGRTDPAPVKVAVGDVRYVIPANCFSSPLETGTTVDGFSVQQAILLTVLWPSGDCHTRENESQFRVAGYGSRITLLIDRYGNGDRRVVFDRDLAMLIKSNRSAYDGSPVPPPSRTEGVEDVWTTDRRPGDTHSPAEIRADRARSYLTYCRMTWAGPPKLTGCSLLMVRTNRVLASFSPELNSNTLKLQDLIVSKLTKFAVSKDF